MYERELISRGRLHTPVCLFADLWKYECVRVQGAKAGPFGGCLAFTQKPGTVDNANPLPADADMFSGVLESLKRRRRLSKLPSVDIQADDDFLLFAEKAQNEQVTIMPSKFSELLCVHHVLMLIASFHSCQEGHTFELDAEQEVAHQTSNPDSTTYGLSSW
jgi:hypothetical protein